MSVTKDEFRERFNVSRETIDRLISYESLVKRWNPAINLVAASTLNDIWNRHFVESAQVYEFSDKLTGSWVDMGSGGGFPGSVVAILAAEKAPNLSVTCIESDIRKCEFLRTVGRITGVKIKVMSRRIEDTPQQGADVISARALSKLDKLLHYTALHLDPKGKGIFLKGETWKMEVEEARKNWDFDLESCESMTNPGSAILKLRNIARA